jgi:exodeoxyribonuclease V alpha subunit
MALLGGAAGNGVTPDVELLEIDAESRSLDVLRNIAVEGYRAYLGERDPEEMLRKLDGFRILCAHREGMFGAEGVNDFVERELLREGLIDRAAPDEWWWHGRPFIITENDYQLDVFNGDTGVIVHGDDGRPRAWLWSPGGRGVRGIAPSRLPAHQTVFAMTVHKAQGSEYDHVVLVLPRRPSRVVTRELLYTGVSRARKRVTIVAPPGVIAAGVAERIQRASGVRERLWNAGPSQAPILNSSKVIAR